jgi:hypothetical protein
MAVERLRGTATTGMSTAEIIVDPGRTRRAKGRK